MKRGQDARTIPKLAGAHASLFNSILERTILGCVFLESTLIDFIASKIEDDDFYGDSHRLIWLSMKRLRDARIEIDHITIREDLNKQGRLAAVGGDEYLFVLTNELPSTHRIESYVEQLAQLGQRRRFVSTLQHVLEHVGTETHADDLVQWGAQQIMSVSAPRDIGKWGADARAIFQMSVQNLQAGAEARERTKSLITGKSTGIEPLDVMTNGVMPGDLVVIAARPGVGKTAFVLGRALTIALDRNELVIFFQMEMPKLQMGDRIICHEGGISLSRWRRAETTAEDMSNLRNLVPYIDAPNGGAGMPFYVYDKPGVRMDEIRAVVRQQKAIWAERGVKLGAVVIDYIQIMGVTNARDQREQQIAYNTRELKVLAKEEECPVYALSQLNRGLEARGNKNKRPQLSDLRESGAIEQDADQVWFLYREEMYNPDTPDRGVAEVIIGKQRAGALGTVRVGWSDTRGMFYAFSNDDSRGAPRDGIYDSNDDSAGF